MTDSVRPATSPPDAPAHDQFARLVRLVGYYASRSQGADRDRVEGLVRQSLRDLGQLVLAESCYLFLFSRTSGKVRKVFLRNSGAPSANAGFITRLSSGAVALSRISWYDRNHDLPAETPEAIREERRLFLEEYRLRSLVNVPLFSEGSLVGALGLASFEREIAVADEFLLLLKTLGQVLVTALSVARREHLLHRSQVRVMKLVSQLDEGMYRMSLPDGRYEYLSRTMEKVLGYPVKDILASPMLVRDVIHSDYREFFAGEWKKLLQGEVPATYEYCIVDASGEQRWIRQSNFVVKDEAGNPVAIEGICRNITAQRRVEEVLLASQDRSQAIIENTSDIILLLDEQGRFAYLTPSLKRITGFSPEELLGHPFQMFLHEDDHAQAEETFFRSLKSPGQTLKLPDIRGRHKDGTWVWYEGYVINLLSIAAVNGLVVSCRDITERKRVENQLLEAQVLLEDRILERTRELAEANERLEIERVSLRDRTVALREVLGQVESDRSELAAQVQTNVEKIALPILEMMEHKGEGVEHYARLLRSCLLDITAPLAHELGRQFPQLTSREQEVCRMVKDGFTCKQIAQTLCISPQTVIKQRKIIRRKLGLSRKSVNLASFLRSLSHKSNKA